MGISNNHGVKFIHPLNKFSKILEDIVIDNDPFFLVKYRSFHNHEIDTNLIANEGLVKDKDINRKGA